MRAMRTMNRRDLLALPGSLLVVGSTASFPEARRFSEARRFARTPFGEIAYVAQGRGRPVLFLHGFPLNGFQWRGAMELLAPYALCIAPDFLGMGHTRSATDQDVGPDSQVLMLASLLDVLGVSS